tara:strand:- start:129 stop:452 length:324 start_codon:yes stop_codon:yes gene_type:complete
LDFAVSCTTKHAQRDGAMSDESEWAFAQGYADDNRKIRVFRRINDNWNKRLLFLKDPELFYPRVPSRSVGVTARQPNNLVAWFSTVKNFELRLDDWWQEVLLIPRFS